LRDRKPALSLFSLSDQLFSVIVVVVKKTDFHWFSVVTLIYHDLRHHMVKMLWTHEAQPKFAAAGL
jgi:hypothetical protein